MVGGGVRRSGEADEVDMPPSGERREVEQALEEEVGGDSEGECECDMVRQDCGTSV